MEIEKVNSDKRGEVWVIGGSNGGFLLISTNPTFKRGGETHHGPQVGYVLTGRMRLYLGNTTHDMRPMVLKSGDTFTIAPEEIHWMEAIEPVLHIESITEYVESCPISKERHNKHYIPEIRDQIFKN